MAKSKDKYVIAGQVFARKQDVVEYVRRVLYGHAPSQVLDGDALEFILALLDQHPWAAEKIGCGVAVIRVEVNETWKANRMFVVERIDGSKTDFSFMKCIYPSSPKSDFLAACRTAVIKDIIAFKQRHFDNNADPANRVKCPISDRSLGWNEVHVDHAPPNTFKAIVDSFIAQEVIDPASLDYCGFDDGQTLKRLADIELAERFRQFHNRLAKLRVIGGIDNLRLPKGR